MTIESQLDCIAEEARTRGDAALVRATDTARLMWANGFRPLGLEGGVWAVESQTTDGVIYHTTAHTCDCAAGIRHRHCWHCALVAAIVTALADARGKSRAADEKTIIYDRATRDFAAYLREEYIASFPSYHDAEVALNDLLLQQIKAGIQ